MTVSKEAFLSPTEFANRYNRTRPIDEDFMPLEPSYVKFLCDQGKITYSVLPSHDGRKNDVYMIPENQIEEVDILLNANTEKALTAEEAAAIIGCDKTWVSVLGRKGDLKRERSIRNGKMVYLYKEEVVKEFAEARKNKKEKVAAKSDEVEELKRIIDELRKKNNKLVFENSDLKDRLKHAVSEDKDIFEAYRRGFKDGFEMGGNK
jgi:predicted transcriptional regulator